MKITINHEGKLISDTVNMTESDFDAFQKKYDEFIQTCANEVVQQTDDSPGLKKSKVLEHLVQNFTNEQLALLALFGADSDIKKACMAIAMEQKLKELGTSLGVSPEEINSLIEKAKSGEGCGDTDCPDCSPKEEQAKLE